MHSRGRHKIRQPIFRRARVRAFSAALATSVGIAAWSAYGMSTGTTTRPASSPTVIASQQPPRTAAPAENTAPPPTTTEQQTPVVPAQGNGQFRPAKGKSERTGAGTTTYYQVEVEEGLPWEPEEIAAIVDATLADQRGWVATGRSFQRKPTADLRVRIATPRTVDRLCAPLLTRGELSCRNGNLILVNAKRWNIGIEAYRRIDDYRTYLINHEVGHAIGYGHRSCPSPGEPAPVMQQQTKSMQSCRPNAWPTNTEFASHE